MNISITTPGKINLFLRVTGKRADGFHELETLFIPIPSIADTLDLELLPDGLSRIEVSAETSGVPDDESNIAGKAARLFLNEHGTKDSVKIRILKRIPVAAGMGGGSSDAAATILALSKLMGELPDGGRTIALKCGADVPYFLTPVPAIGRGIGEELEPVHGLHLPEFGIHPPNFPVTAAWAYRHMKKEPERGRTLANLLAALRNADFNAAAGFIHNDLEPAVRAKFPILDIMTEKIMNNGARCVRMTGSGPTLFSF